MRDPRKVTNKLIDAAEEGALSWEAIARGFLAYCSETDVQDMAESEGLVDIEEEEEEEEEDSDGAPFHGGRDPGQF